MRYRLEQPGFNQLLRDADDVVLNLPEHVVGLEDAVADLKMALDNTDCSGSVETCGADVLLPDARATVVRCENVVGAGWGISEAVSAGDESMADDARGNAK
ncbi:hypothetical protein [Zhihengliuella salsuginis]|uniref:Uncharacterized protein n=1 Tax=Zhihengliuella salsuginis TaxID=578222 RepID=A0ABQ3GDK8_9MICC|nr:hypothetical protein [Zhihengliuella salsuginis]GHD00275.1 hypothetical protein GCM10008096_03360 [Zhihengliuella salsuginis]